MRLPRPALADFQRYAPPKKINGFRIVRVEIAAVAYGSFAMTLRVTLAHFRHFLTRDSPIVFVTPLGTPYGGNEHV